MGAVLSQVLQEMHSKRGWIILAGVAFIALVLVPVANMLPEDSFFHIPDYTIKLIGKYVCFAMLALALDLIWGYTGILSLGHAVFFAFGAYCMGIHLLQNVMNSGVAATDITVMGMMDWRELPWFWHGFDSFFYTSIMILLIPGLFAFIFGFLAFRSRVKGVYFAIITQALTFALFLLFRQNEVGLGGTNGLTGFKTLAGFSLEASSTKVALYMISVGLLLMVYLVSRYTVSSKLGRVLTSIRDAEARVMFCGYNPVNYKLFAWTASAVICGIAGALFVPQVGIINPDELKPANSIDIAIWDALGGRGTLAGAVAGAGLVNGAKSWFSGMWENVWPIIMGLIFILVPLFFSRGLATFIKPRMAKIPESGGND